MIVTEAEAATKWCPFARVYALEQSQDSDGRVHNSSTSFNRNDTWGLPVGSGCVGSRCMSWVETGSRMKRNEDGSLVMPPNQEILGCCGLAYAGRKP